MIAPSLLPKRVYKGLVLFLHKCSKNLQVRPSEIRVLFMGRFVIINLILPNVLNGRKAPNVLNGKIKVFPSVFRTIPKVLHRKWAQDTHLTAGRLRLSAGHTAMSPSFLSSFSLTSHHDLLPDHSSSLQAPRPGYICPLTHTHTHLNSSKSRWVRPMHTHGCHSCRGPVVGLGDPVSTHLFQ